MRDEHTSNQINGDHILGRGQVSLSDLAANCDPSQDTDCIDEGQNMYDDQASVYDKDNWNVLSSKRFSPIQRFLYDGGGDIEVGKEKVPIRHMSNPYSKLGTRFKMDGTIIASA